MIIKVTLPVGASMVTAASLIRTYSNTWKKYISESNKQADNNLLVMFGLFELPYIQKQDYILNDV